MRERRFSTGIGNAGTIDRANCLTGWFQNEDLWHVLEIVLPLTSSISISHGKLVVL